jgi:hypothetical protein
MIDIDAALAARAAQLIEASAGESEPTIQRLGTIARDQVSCSRGCEQKRSRYERGLCVASCFGHRCQAIHQSTTSQAFIKCSAEVGVMLGKYLL